MSRVSIAGVRLPDPATLKGKTIGKRVYVLGKYARKVLNKTPAGIDLEDARAFVKHWRSAFGCLKLLLSQPLPDGRREYKLRVDWYCCQHCRTEFDEKDCKSICTEGAMCPKCGEVVVKAVVSREAGPEAKAQEEGEKK